MKAVIVGGGIGGATAALSLLDNGFDVEVYEQATELREIGAGLQISANAVKVLNNYVEPELLRFGVQPEALVMRDLVTDRKLYSVPLGQISADRNGANYYELHRPDLLDMLIGKVPTDVMRLGERAVRFEQDPTSVTVHFESGRVANGDVLIGADGIHSIVRKQMLGEQDPEFSQIVAWRALIPRQRVESLNLPQYCHIWLGANRSAVVYWVHAGELLNFTGMVPSNETQDESWTTTGKVDALRRSYIGCATSLQAIVEAIDEPFVTGYYFRYPLSTWTDGRVVILGDAAHPMQPFVGQGACQAIEDAGVLGPILGKASPESVIDVLEEFQNIRYARASNVQNASRTHEHMWHMSEPREVLQRNRIFASTMELDPYGDTVYGTLYRYDPNRAAAVGYQAPWHVLRRPEAQRAWRMYANMFSPLDFERQHHSLRIAFDRFQKENVPLPEGAAITTAATDLTQRVELVIAGEFGRATAPVLLHFHGGGYLLGSAAGSAGLVARLAQCVDGTCVSVDYRRAPEDPFPAALEDARQAYRWLLDQDVAPSRIILSGESSGGGLAIALALLLRQESQPLPASIVAMSPMADLALTGASIDRVGGDEPAATRELLTSFAASYLQGHDPRDPFASPIYGCFTGLPPIHLVVGSNESLYSDTERLAHVATRDGVAVEVDEYDDTVHVFPMFEFLPESAAALERIGAFARAYASGANTGSVPGTRSITGAISSGG